MTLKPQRHLLPILRFPNKRKPKKTMPHLLLRKHIWKRMLRLSPKNRASKYSRIAILHVQMRILEHTRITRPLNRVQVMHLLTRFLISRPLTIRIPKTSQNRQWRLSCLQRKLRTIRRPRKSNQKEQKRAMILK